jgi:hypothetical protein
MSDVNAYLKDMTGSVVGTVGNPLYVSAEVSNTTITATINAEDIEIGSVEIKNATDDTRAKVKTDGTDNALVVVMNTIPAITGSVDAAQSGAWGVTATVSGDVNAAQSGAWYVTATQDAAWYVNATVSGAVSAAQSGAWGVSATVTTPASGVWTREAIHSGTSIFNTALPATSTDWFTPIAPTYSPAYFNVHVAVATTGKLSYSRTRAGATVVCDFNSGVNLTASAEYAFTIPALTGDTISLRYDQYGYNILSCYVFEKGA